MLDAGHESQHLSEIMIEPVRRIAIIPLRFDCLQRFSATFTTIAEEPTNGIHLR